MCIQLRSNISPLVEAKQKDNVIVEPKQKEEIKSDKVAPKVAAQITPQPLKFVPSEEIIGDIDSTFASAKLNPAKAEKGISLGIVTIVDAPKFEPRRFEFQKDLKVVSSRFSNVSTEKMPSSESFMEKFTQDKKAFEQIPKIETFSIECIGTHTLAESIINGNEPTEKRLDKIPKLLKNYKEVEAKLESNINSVNSYIEDLQQLFLNSEGKEKEGYGKLMETALKTKKELVKLYGEFATAFASDAAKIGKESTFSGFFLTVYRTERMGLIDESQKSVNKAISFMSETFPESRRSPEVKDKLSQLKVFSEIIPNDLEKYKERVTEVNTKAYKRFVTLTNLSINVAQLINGDGVGKKDSIESLIVKLQSNTNTEEVNNARQELQKRGKELFETIKTAKKEYGNPANYPNPSILDALKLMVAKVEKYDLGNLGKDGRDLVGDKSAIADINKDLDALFKLMKSKPQFYRVGEVDLTQGVDKQLRDVEKLSVVEGKRKALQGEIVDFMIDKSTVGEILGVSARIFESGSDVLPDIEKTPKAKTLPEKRTELFNSLISGLEKKITEYKSLIPKSVEKPDETPQVKIFSSLVTILKEISKKPDDNNNTEIAKNLTLIKSLMSELKSPELEKVNKLVETVKYLQEKVNRDNTVVGTFDDKDQAMSKCHEMASQDPKNMYEVVEISRNKEYRVLKFPESAFKEKHEVSKQLNSSIIYLSVSREGKTYDVNRLTADFPKNSIPEEFKREHSPTDVKKYSINNPEFRDSVINKIGSRAKDLLGEQYSKSMDLLMTLGKSQSKVVDTLFTLAANNNIDKMKDFLVNMCGLDATKSQVDTWCIKIMNKYKEYTKALIDTPMDETNAKKIRDNFECSDFISTTLLQGIQERTKQTSKALLDVGMMSDKEAAMTIVKDFPSIRAQIYREFDFSVDPKFLPEDSGQVKVSRPTSNAESVFYQEAKSNSTIQTAESVAKTAGIIAFTIAAGTVAGPFGIAAVGGTMMTTSAIVAGMDIYEAEKNHTRANVNYLSGLIDKKQLEESDKERMLSYASGIFQVMTAGLSVGFSSALSPQTLAKSLLLDGAINLGQAILDPKNMANIADGKGIKDIGFNIILSGSITFLTHSSPKVGKSSIKGELHEVIFDPEKNKFSARTADGKIHDLVPVKSEGNNLTFKIGNSEETIKLSVEKEKVAIENKPAKPVSNATPKSKQELGHSTLSTDHASTGTTVKSDTSADVHVEPQKPNSPHVNQDLQNQRDMDFYQARLGFGTTKEGVTAWKELKTETVALAMKKGGLDAAKKVEKAFFEAEKAFSKINNDIEVVKKDLKAKGTKGSESEITELAVNHLRDKKEAEMLDFMEKNKDVFYQDTLAGKDARVKLNKMQREMRTLWPEAYIGDAAAGWGASGKDATGRDMMTPFAKGMSKGEHVQARVSQAQYINTWVSALEGVKDLPTRIWKAGKYDLRDNFFQGLQLNKKGTFTYGKDVDLKGFMKNPHFDPQAPKNSTKSLEFIPKDEMDATIFMVKNCAKNPTEAMAIWKSQFGDRAEQVMKEYLHTLKLTSQDTLKLHMATPIKGVEPTIPVMRKASDSSTLTPPAKVARPEANGQSEVFNLPTKDAPILLPSGEKITSITEMETFLHNNIDSNPGKIMDFYKEVGWDYIRSLDGKITPDLFEKIHTVRDKKVSEIWERVKAQAESEHGVKFAEPYVGTPPGGKGYNKAWSDVDFSMKVESSNGKVMTEVDKAIIEMKVMREMRKELGKLVPTSGHSLDVNVYSRPISMEIEMF